MHSPAKVWLTNSGEAQDSITGSGWVKAEGLETIAHVADCVCITRHWLRFSLNGYNYCWWTYIWSGLWKALIRHRKKNHSVRPIHLWLCDMWTLILSLCSSLFFITGLGSGQSVSLLGESGEMLTVLCFSTMVFSLCPSQSLVRSEHSRLGELNSPLSLIIVIPQQWLLSEGSSPFQCCNTHFIMCQIWQWDLNTMGADARLERTHLHNCAWWVVHSENVCMSESY